MNLFSSRGLQRYLPFVLLLLVLTGFILWPVITGTVLTVACIVLLVLVCLACLGVELNLPKFLSFNFDLNFD